MCSVKYNDLDHAVVTSMKILKMERVNQLFYAKSDFSNAFRILAIKIGHQQFLVLKATHPVTHVVFYFIDKCLPFGSSISCTHFQSFSDAIKHIIDWKIVKVLSIRIPSTTNYLDDFLFIAKTLQLFNSIVSLFLQICSQIGCPIADEKTEWALQLLVFLGILLNGKSLLLSLPWDKRVKALSQLQEAISKRKVTVKTVQNLTGTLNFLHRAIVLGRAFTQGMYDRLAGNKTSVLKPHHHIYLNQQFITDCKLWMNFLTDIDNEKLYRPFVDLCSTQFDHLKVQNFYSDASRSEILGMGPFMMIDVGFSTNGQLISSKIPSLA